ncbi:MAG: alkaline phosphatase family protein [Polyangiales bacterium]
MLVRRLCRLASFGATAGLAVFFASCGSSDSPAPGVANSEIKHLVVIVQENHSFDNYYGSYCKASSGTNPSCNEGPDCCEGVPPLDPNGVAPSLLNDESNSSYDPDHTQECELAEINGGLMDGFTEGPACADARNFAVADTAAKPYWDLAHGGALADRYFQPIVGQSSANDMYFAAAKFVFLDNAFVPDFVVSRCAINPNVMDFTGPNLGDLLTTAGVPWTVYAEGLGVARTAVAAGECPAPDPACPLALPIYPCVFDASDIPYAYFGADSADTEHFADFSRMSADIDAGTLPDYSFVKFYGFRTEHPGYGTTITDGTDPVTALIDQIQASPYASDTLILITWDESGGYFDHIAPPPTPDVDRQPYGARVPMLAIGPFAREDWISHVTMEHSSIVKFIEWNWFGGETGQLGGRDATVHNIGSLLDSTVTGSTVPE